MPDRRRLLSDDLRRGRGGEAAWAHTADRGARRQVARAHQGQADSPSVPALRHRAAGRRLSRAARALFRRACGRRAQRGRARDRGAQGARRERPNRDRGCRGFGALCGHCLRLTTASPRTADLLADAVDLAPLLALLGLLHGCHIRILALASTTATVLAAKATAS